MKTESNPSALATKSLFQNKRFVFLWIASLFSGFALPIYLLAEQWYVVKALDLHTFVGWVMMATALPRVILMIFGGVVADRFSCSKIIMVANFSRSFLIIVLIALLWVDQLNIYFLLSFAVLFGILDAFFWPASESILPFIVTKDQITQGNSLIQTTNQLSTIIGPVLAGFVLYQFDYMGIFATCSLLLLLAGSFAIPVKDKLEEQKDQKSKVWEDLQEGIQQVVKSTFLKVLMSVLIIVNFFISGPVAIGIPLIVDQILRGDVLELSYLQSAFGLGALVGAILVGTMNIRTKRGLILFSSLVLISLFFLLLSLITSMWQGIILLVLIGVGTMLINIPLISMVQEKIEMAKMGRVMSFVMTLSIGLLPLSYGVCSSLLILDFTIQDILLVSGITVMLYSLIATWKFKEVRKMD